MEKRVYVEPQVEVLEIAIEKGFFEEAGLEVEIVQPPEDGAVVLVASGKAQFGVSFQDSLAPAFVEGEALPVTAVASVILRRIPKIGRYIA